MTISPNRWDNNVLIRSGEALAIVWSRIILYSGFNILPRSVFWSAYLNGRSDNLDVMWLSEFSAVDNRGHSVDAGWAVGTLAGKANRRAQQNAVNRTSSS